MKQYTKAVCRGSWALGTACGKCERCEDTRPRTTPFPEVIQADYDIARTLLFDIMGAGYAESATNVYEVARYFARHRRAALASADRNPEGGNAVPSRSDESAVHEVETPQSPPTPPHHSLGE